LCQIVAFIPVLLQLPDTRAHNSGVSLMPQFDDYQFQFIIGLAVASKLQ
jgi:hypothetical protein